MLDTFAIGFTDQGLTASIWFAITFGLGVFLGGNLIIACLISFVLAGFGIPIVWGILGGSMPRSGGEYIYNSRIIHPVFGMAQSFGNALCWIMWVYVQCALIIEPGLTMTFRYLGWSGAADWAVSSKWIMLALASAFNIVAVLFVAFGMRIFAFIQKIVLFIGIGGCVAICIVLTVTSRAHFVAAWNSAAAASGSPDYTGFIAKVGEAAGTAMPTTWNWNATLGCMVAMSWLFAYAYSISYVGGEVKRPEKTIMWANFFSILIPAALMLWTALALNKTVGYQFLNASAWNDQNGPVQGFGMPFGSNYIDLAVYAIGTSTLLTKLLAAFMALSYVAFVLWMTTLSYMAFPRILFAWGMDRMGPKWFTDINPRWASPLKNYLLAFVIGEGLVAFYYVFLQNQLQNVIITGIQITTLFIPTAIAGIYFPYSRRAKGIWEASPYRTWAFLGVPIIVWGGLVYLVYVGLMLYYFVFNDAAKQFTTAGNVLMVATWLAGVAWYFYWKARSEKVGVNVSLTYGELPPD